MHHQHFQFPHIGHDDALESIGEHIPRFLIGTIPDGGHGNGTLETTTDAAVDTLGFTPGGTHDAHELIGLMAGELFGSLFDDGFFT